MVRQKIKELKDLYGIPCVTISLQTHRTAPENKQDSILLKGLMKQAVQKVEEQFGKTAADLIETQLQQLVDSIDHQHNLDALLLFVNNDIAEYVRLPVNVENRIVVDGTFATRDLFRALHQAESYYVLSLNQKSARLYEAYEREVITEIENDLFPFENDLTGLNPELVSESKRQDNLTKEYFNRVDKRLNAFLNDYPGLVVVATVERNYHFLIEVADHPEVYIGWMNEHSDKQPDTFMLRDAWVKVLQYLAVQKELSLQQLEEAVGKNKFASDLNDIWLAVQEGRGDTLLVEKGYFQSARLNQGHLQAVSHVNGPGDIDDIVDEMIELHMGKKGKVIFVEDGRLEQFDRIAMTLRY